MQNKTISRVRSVDKQNRMWAIERMESRLLLSLSTFLVNTTSDSSVGVAGLLTLRQAVSAANSNNVPSTIQFDPKVFTPGSLHTITLTQGELEFRSGVTTVNGPGADVLAISGSQKSRVFQIDPKATVSLNGITVTGGLSNVADASYNTSGGGILNSGTLTVNQSTVSGNAVVSLGANVNDFSYTPGSGMGGGIYSAGPLTITNSILNANSVVNAPTMLPLYPLIGGNAGASFGGAVYCTGNLIASGDTFTNNKINGISAVNYGEPPSGGDVEGGGIYAAGTVSISNCTISGNAADAGNASTEGGGNASGGGLFSIGETTVSSSTVTHNSAGAGASAIDYGETGTAEGGGIWNESGLTIISSTVSNNVAGVGNAYGGDVSRGGGIFEAGNLMLSQSTVDGNTLTGSSPFYLGEIMAAGGGIYTGGSITVQQSSVSGNVENCQLPFDFYGGTSVGGGIDANGGGTISESTISGNTSAGGDGYGGPIIFDYEPHAGGDSDGGGIYSSGALTVSASTVSNNIANGGEGGDGASDGQYNGQNGGNAYGGSIYCTADLELIDSTLTGNTADAGNGGTAGEYRHGGDGGSGAGGGIFSNSTLEVVNCTLTGNTTANGEGGTVPPTYKSYFYYPGSPGTATAGGIDSTESSATLTNSIISGDKAGSDFSDLAGNIASSCSHDLIGVGGGLTNGVNGNIVGVNNPDLLPLGNYGGPTKTMVPIAGSPVINAGSVALIPTGLTTDQRGYSRTHGNTVDIGAVEFGNATITGTVFNDEYATGTLTKGDPGLAGFTVYLDLNHDGKYESTDIASVSNASGQYTFADVPAGTYAVNIVSQVMYRPTAPSALPVSVVTTNGKTTTGPTFAETQDALLSGSVINSKTGKPLSGFRVYVDLNSDGKWESTEPSVVTASNGTWSFNIPSPGTYSVRILTLPGYTTVLPANSLFTFVVGKASARIGNIFDELPTS